jgi:hypothetical protein
MEIYPSSWYRLLLTSNFLRTLFPYDASHAADTARKFISSYILTLACLHSTREKKVNRKQRNQHAHCCIPIHTTSVRWNTRVRTPASTEIRQCSRNVPQSLFTNGGRLTLTVRGRSSLKRLDHYILSANLHIKRAVLQRNFRSQHDETWTGTGMAKYVLLS